MTVTVGGGSPPAPGDLGPVYESDPLFYDDLLAEALAPVPYDYGDAFAIGTGGGGAAGAALVGPDGAPLVQVDPGFAGADVRVAVGDVNGDGVPDLITGAGPGSDPRVKVYSGADGSPLQDFDAFEPSFDGGVYVAAGDLTGDGVDELIVSPDRGGGPRVLVLDGRTLAVVANFYRTSGAGPGWRSGT